MKVRNIGDLFVLNLIIWLGACSKGGSSGSVAEIVYISGYEESAGFSISKIWKDGVATALTDGTHASSLSSLFLSGTDVFVGGTDYDSITGEIGKHWKNNEGTAVDRIASDSSRINGITVVDGQVHAAGQIDDVALRAIYWLDGNSSYLTDGTRAASALGIYADESDIYIAGFENNGSVNVAKIWKNGVATLLTDGTRNAKALSVFVYQSDVYAAGFENNGTNNVAKYWKNGVESALSDGSAGAMATALVIENGDVHAAGFDGNVLKSWKNDEATSLTDGVNSSYAGGLAVSGDDIYIVGSENSGVLDHAKVWKNGVSTPLTDGAYNSYASAIAIGP